MQQAHTFFSRNDVLLSSDGLMVIFGEKTFCNSASSIGSIWPFDVFVCITTSFQWSFRRHRQVDEKTLGTKVFLELYLNLRYSTIFIKKM